MAIAMADDMYADRVVSEGMSTRFDLGEGVLEASLTKTLDMELYNWLGRKPEFGMPLTGNRSSFLKNGSRYLWGMRS